jgi:hypothetical protein
MSNESASSLRVVGTHLKARFVLKHVVEVVERVEILVLESEVEFIVWFKD